MFGNSRTFSHSDLETLIAGIFEVFLFSMDTFFAVGFKIDFQIIVHFICSFQKLLQPVHEGSLARTCRAVQRVLLRNLFAPRKIVVNKVSHIFVRRVFRLFLRSMIGIHQMARRHCRVCQLSCLVANICSWDYIRAFSHRLYAISLSDTSIRTV